MHWWIQVSTQRLRAELLVAAVDFAQDLSGNYLSGNLIPWNDERAANFQVGALDPVGALDGGDGSSVFTGDGPKSVAFFNRVTDGLGGDFNRFWFWLRS